MSGTNSAEYKLFLRNHARIADAIGDISGLIVSIVDELYAKGIVGKTVRDAADIHAPDVTEIKRVRPVLKAILKKIELNKDVYYKVRDVLLASEPGLKQLLPKEPPTEDESEDEGDGDTPSGAPLSTHTTNVPKHAKTSLPEHGTTSGWNCWPCGCYVFIAAAALALAVVAVLYVNNGIPAAGSCHRIDISKKQELEKAVAEIGDWETLCENLGVPKSVISTLRFSDKQTGRKKSECLEAYLDTDKACWEQVVKVIAEFPFLNKRLARQIANKQSVDYSSVVKDEL